MKSEQIDNKNFYYPPGGILLWIIITIELITFGVALIVLVMSKEDPELFHKSRLLLNSTYGATNTVFLLVSGFFMATTVHLFKKGNFDKASFYLNLTMIGGLLFLVLKSIEYYHKVESGLLIDHNTFFTFYWLLTGFHVIHVLVGLVILTYFKFTLKKLETEDLEAGAAFWHMCDLIWLLLFPVIYLIL